MFNKLESYFGPKQNTPTAIINNNNNNNNQPIINNNNNSTINITITENIQPEINIISSIIDESVFLPNLTNDVEKTLHAIKATNIFSSPEERQRTLQMGCIANLMYKDYIEIEDIDHLFPNHLYMLPTPEELGIDLPIGLRVQAFRHRGEVIIGMRGTEITKDRSTAVANIVAGMGIGRHKSTDDIMGSINKVKNKVKCLYNYELNDKLCENFEVLLNNRIEGSSDKEMAISYGKELASGVGKGVVIGGGVGSGLGIVLGGVVAFGSGVATGGLSILIGASIAASGAALGATGGLVKTVAKKMIMLADGNCAIDNYIKAIDQYIEKLRELKIITKKDMVVTAGHSLGGFLSGVSGALQADEAYSFNGPGVVLEKDVKNIAENIGIQRKPHSHFHCHTVKMEGDFIGNFGARDGSQKTLHLPFVLGGETEQFPGCAYDGLLAHHGIHLIKALLENTTVQSMPKCIKIVLLDKNKKFEIEEGPRVEEIEDEPKV